MPTATRPQSRDKERLVRQKVPHKPFQSVPCRPPNDWTRSLKNMELFNKKYFSSLCSPEQDGKVSDLVRNLVDEDGEGGDQAELERREEAGGDRQPVDEVVDAVGRQVEVAQDPFLPNLQLVVVLLLILLGELKDLLKDEEGENASQDPESHHQQSCVAAAMISESRQWLWEKMEKDVSQKSSHCKA